MARLKPRYMPGYDSSSTRVGEGGGPSHNMHYVSGGGSTYMSGSGEMEDSPGQADDRTVVQGSYGTRVIPPTHPINYHPVSMGINALGRAFNAGSSFFNSAKNAYNDYSFYNSLSDDPIEQRRYSNLVSSRYLSKALKGKGIFTDEAGQNASLVPNQAVLKNENRSELYAHRDRLRMRLQHARQHASRNMYIQPKPVPVNNPVPGYRTGKVQKRNFSAPTSVRKYCGQVCPPKKDHLNPTTHGFAPATVEHHPVGQTKCVDIHVPFVSRIQVTPSTNAIPSCVFNGMSMGMEFYQRLGCDVNLISLSISGRINFEDAFTTGSGPTPMVRYVIFYDRDTRGVPTTWADLIRGYTCDGLVTSGLMDHYNPDHSSRYTVLVDRSISYSGFNFTGPLGPNVIRPVYSAGISESVNNRNITHCIDLRGLRSLFDGQLTTGTSSAHFGAAPGFQGAGMFVHGGIFFAALCSDSLFQGSGSVASIELSSRLCFSDC